MQIAKSTSESLTINASVPPPTLVQAIIHSGPHALRMMTPGTSMKKTRRLILQSKILRKASKSMKWLQLYSQKNPSTWSRNRVDEPSGEEVPAGEVEVINPMTGEVERIRTDDPSYYDASGFKARKYKNSSKPKDIPPSVWQAMSQKERRLAIAEEQKTLALKKRKRNAPEGWKLYPWSELSRAHKMTWKKTWPMSLSQLCLLARWTLKNIGIYKCIRLGIQSGKKAVNTLVARPVVHLRRRQPRLLIHPAIFRLKPAKKAMLRQKLKVVEEAHGPRHPKALVRLIPAY